MTLSPQLQLVLDHIEVYIAEQGYAPSVREICQATGIKSTSTVHGYLRRLEEAGCIRRDTTKPRAMVILANAKNAAHADKVDHDADHDHDNDNTPEASQKPITGQSEQLFSAQLVSASNAYSSSNSNSSRNGIYTPFIPFDSIPSVKAPMEHFLADQRLEETDPWILPQTMLGDKAAFVTTMPDDSMVNRQLASGDYLLVFLQDSANNGDIVIAVHHGQVAIRAYYKGLQQIRLQAENEQLDIQIIDPRELTILGVVGGFFRGF